MKIQLPETGSPSGDPPKPQPLLSDVLYGLPATLDIWVIYRSSQKTQEETTTLNGSLTLHVGRRGTWWPVAPVLTYLICLVSG